MNTGHDDFDRYRAAQAFAAEHPEIAAELKAAVARVVGTHPIQYQTRETVLGFGVIATVFVLLLVGREWFGWDSWALVGLGVTGIILVAALVELAVWFFAPLMRAIRRPRGGRRR